MILTSHPKSIRWPSDRLMNEESELCDGFSSEREFERVHPVRQKVSVASLALEVIIAGVAVTAAVPCRLRLSTTTTTFVLVLNLGDGDALIVIVFQKQLLLEQANARRLQVETVCTWYCNFSF